MKSLEQMILKFKLTPRILYTAVTLALAIPYLCIFAVNAIAQATGSPASVPTQAQILPLILQIAQAIQSHNWHLVVGFGIMLLSSGISLLLSEELSAKQQVIVLPWITIAFGFLLQFAANLVSGGSWGAAAQSALITGTAAAGLWQALGQHMLSLVQGWFPQAPVVNTPAAVAAARIKSVPK